MNALHTFIKRFGLALVLLWTLGLGTFLAWNDSMTTDEGIHVASAYLGLTRHDLRFDPEHPFLFKYATAVPLLALRPRLPADDKELWDTAYPTTFDSWEQSRRWTEEWFYRSGNDARLMIFLARIPGVICFTLLCWLTWYLGTLWFSRRIGWLALLFTAFNPSLIGHGHLTNTDVPVALAMLAAMWAMWRYFKRPTLASAAVLGLLVGVAETTKFSAITLVPSVLLWLGYCAWQERSWRRTAGDAALAVLTAIAWIWIVYQMPLHLIQGTAFSIKGAAVLPDKVQQQAPASLTGLFGKFILIRYVLPVDYVKGIMLVAGGSVYGRAAYLLGVAHKSGFWYYFPVLYALKTQLAGLLLLLAALGAALARRRGPRSWRPVTILFLAVFGVFGAATVVNKLNIGIRHIAPLMVCASFGMALGGEWLQERFAARRWLVPALTAVYCLGIFVHFPDFIGYGNAFVPRAKAYEAYNDSNLDWGQQARAIAETMRSRFPGKPLYMNYQWSPYALQYYGATVRPFDPKHPPREAVVGVAATQMTWDEYAAFRAMDPAYRLGDTTYFFTTK